MKGKIKIPLLLLSISAMENIGNRFTVFGTALAKLKPGLQKDLVSVGVEISAANYAFGSFASALIYGVIFFLLVLLITGARGGFAQDIYSIDYKIPAAVGIAFFAMFFMLHIIYPKILARKTAAKENKDLLFALRDIMMMVESGVLLFDAMKNVAKSDYGYASNDFEKVVRKVETGVSEREALKILALTSESEYMKRACWQLVNALESGATIAHAIGSIVDALEVQTYRDIKNYSSNLSFLMLLYMLVAAAIPSLGITFLTLLSAFSGVGVTIETIWTIIGISFSVQLAFIGFMSATRPELFGG